MGGDDFDDLGNYEHTDFDGEDVVVIRDELGRAAMVPASVRRLDPELRQDVRGLMLAAAEVHRLQEEIAARVGELRDQGVSWSAIGWSVGTTGEAARQRWGR